MEGCTFWTWPPDAGGVCIYYINKNDKQAPPTDHCPTGRFNIKSVESPFHPNGKGGRDLVGLQGRGFRRSVLMVWI